MSAPLGSLPTSLHVEASRTPRATCQLPTYRCAQRCRCRQPPRSCILSTGLAQLGSFGKDPGKKNPSRHRHGPASCTLDEIRAERATPEPHRRLGQTPRRCERRHRVGPWNLRPSELRGRARSSSTGGAGSYAATLPSAPSGPRRMRVAVTRPRRAILPTSGLGSGSLRTAHCGRLTAGGSLRATDCGRLASDRIWDRDATRFSTHLRSRTRSLPWRPPCRRPR